MMTLDVATLIPAATCVARLRVFSLFNGLIVKDVIVIYPLIDDKELKEAEGYARCHGFGGRC